MTNRSFYPVAGFATRFCAHGQPRWHSWPRSPWAAAGSVRTALTTSRVSVEAIRLEGVHHLVTDDDAVLVLAKMATAFCNLYLAVAPLFCFGLSTAPPPGACARSAPRASHTAAHARCRRRRCPRRARPGVPRPLHAQAGVHPVLPVCCCSSSSTCMGND